MAPKIEIKVANKTLFEIPIDHLNEDERNLIAENLNMAQIMLKNGLPERAAIYAGTALLIPSITKLFEGNGE